MNMEAGRVILHRGLCFFIFRANPRLGQSRSGVGLSMGSVLQQLCCFGLPPQAGPFPSLSRGRGPSSRFRPSIGRLHFLEQPVGHGSGKDLIQFWKSRAVITDYIFEMRESFSISGEFYEIRIMSFHFRFFHLSLWRKVWKTPVTITVFWLSFRV
jgi:hypothetical protein